MKFILARKGRMTQIFDEKGTVSAATLVTAGPMVVTQVKGADTKDGYSAIQVGFEGQKAQRIAKPVLGHTKGVPYKVLKEFRVEDTAGLALGDEIKVDTFAEGDSIVVTSTSKGHGFAGVVKRHGFHGGRRSHGQKHSEREPGSIGGGGRAGGRVIKGMRMGGRMGNDRVTIKNLRVLKVDAATGEMLISGAIPGAPGALVEIRSM
ncbi:MAG: ribosomal protein L3 [Parcubacteria bacterium C7867-004]|nr:MAG: ribosomal protein L3 [Parcubacteria bacterium C7867-004]